MRVSLASHVGLVREKNEDQLCVWEIPGRPSHTLLAVADGMGGYQAGEVASNLAIETLKKYVGDALHPDKGRTRHSPERLLLNGIRMANRRVFRRARSEDELAGMGTTMTAALVAGQRLFFAHVGDSRAYLIHQGQLCQITDDHSLVAELVRDGRLSEAEALCHPQRHVLTRALGVEREMSIDVGHLAVEPGDLLVLATDGLTNLISGQEILKILKNGTSDFDLLAPKLIKMANKKGGRDNVTVIVAEI